MAQSFTRLEKGGALLFISFRKELAADDVKGAGRTISKKGRLVIMR